MSIRLSGKPPRKIIGALVHQASDEYGDILVLDYPQYRVMTFDSSYEQSGFCLEKPYLLVHEYARTMLLALEFVRPTSITLLGLGGGSLLRSLHHFLDDCEFHVIELRPKVLELAKRFFDIPTDARTHFYVTDAGEYLGQDNQLKTDIIFADLYDATEMCSLQAQCAFLEKCEQKLSSRGILVINYHKLPNRHSALFLQLRSNFSTILICAGEFNSHVLFACKAHCDIVKREWSITKTLEDILGGDFQSMTERFEVISD